MSTVQDLTMTANFTYSKVWYLGILSKINTPNSSCLNLRVF